MQAGGHRLPPRGRRRRSHPRDRLDGRVLATVALIGGRRRGAQTGPVELYPADDRAEILPLIPHGTGAVLDVGCGRGGFGRSLRASGRAATITAMEPSEVFAREAATHYDEVIVGTFPDALATSGTKFACIVFNDVLEHMVDPWHALRRAQDHLEPTGAVVASIPNVRNARTAFDLVVRGHWTYADMGVLDRTHLRFFTKRSLTALFEDTGYVVQQIYGINALGRSRPPLGHIGPRLMGEFAYTGFGVRAVPTDHRW